MKTTLTFFICIILAHSQSYGQSEILRAEKFIQSLEENSVKYHGVSLNEYLILDIDRNGIYEIIERVNMIEQDAVGFLNSELSQAFNFDKIYKFENGEFIENYGDFNSYNDRRLDHYQFWKRLLNNPEILISDSQMLIKANKELFLQEIGRLIKLTEERMK